MLPLLLRSPEVVLSTDRPTVPSRLDPPRWWTADVRDSPPGAAVALVEYMGPFSGGHLTVGARTNRVRSVAAIADRSMDFVYPSRLSPDGRRVAIGGEVTDETGVVVVDLSTGESRGYGTEGGYVDVLAWSPDSTLLAYAHDGSTLEVLDTRTGGSRRAFEALVPGQREPQRGLADPLQAAQRAGEQRLELGQPQRLGRGGQRARGGHFVGHDGS
jgi:hypothetical protein